MDEWTAVEESLPNKGENVAVWLVAAENEREISNVTFAKLAHHSPAPLWLDRKGGEYGKPDSVWRVTHWLRSSAAE